MCVCFNENTLKAHRERDYMKQVWETKTYTSQSVFNAEITHKEAHTCI